MDENLQDTLKALDFSLDALEEALEALLVRPLAETLESLHGPMERAKLDILLAYAINNLVWIYLKTRGIEPDSHDVARELERIKGYYGKVREAENPTQRTRTIDRSAAKRFVSAAIPVSQRLPAIPAPVDPPNTSAAATARVQAEAAIDRFGHANRFRFIPSEGEKARPDGERIQERLDLDDEGDKEAEETDEDDAVEAFFSSMDDEMAGMNDGGGSSSYTERTSSESRSKRRREEEV